MQHADGTSETPTLVRADAETSNRDAAGNVIRNSSYYMQYHYGSLTGPLDEFRLVPHLVSPLQDISKLDVAIFGLGGAGKAQDCDGLQERFCAYFTLDPRDVFKVVVRTSWVWPNDAEAMARQGNISVETFGPGHRWTFTGKQLVLAIPPAGSWNAIMNSGAEYQAEKMRPWLAWRLHHASTPKHSFFAQTVQCAKYGYAFRSGNGSSNGTPTWDKGSQSLNFNVYSAHLDTNGDLFHGFFYTRLPRAYLDCAFPGNTLAHASQVAVSVTYADSGDTQSVLSITKVDKDYIYVSVPDFHYSAPTIKVKSADAAPTAAKPANSPRPSAGSSLSAVSKTSSKRPQTFTCIKGQRSQRLTAATPKCPSGWKLKK